MKKIILLSVFMAVCVSSFAQTERGKFFFSGGTGMQFSFINSRSVYNGHAGTPNNYGSISLSPSFGYFVANNFCIGFGGTYTYAFSSGDYALVTLTEPAFIFYFPLKSPVRPVIQVGVGLVTQTTDGGSALGYAINPGFGIACFVKDNISLNIGLSYTRASIFDSDNPGHRVDQNNFGTNVGFSIFF